MMTVEYYRSIYSWLMKSNKKMRFKFTCKPTYDWEHDWIGQWFDNWDDR